MTLRERITGIQALLNAPPTSEDFIVYPGEIPWWEIEGLGERQKVYHRQQMRAFYKLRPGYHAETNRKFSERHPGYFAAYMKEYYKEHPGYSVETMRRLREKHPGYAIEVTNKYNRTPKGKAAIAYKKAVRRNRSTDPELYAARIELLHILQEPCTKCHTVYNITHQVDHIIALCLGGTDSWDNLQPLCILCHRDKTGEDMREFRRRQHS